ncbi:MAG: hypothetical protein H0W83_16630, partial [Planctomycetes bacterium]|nr:hypothetical protein [Planctomycetota bacterium]
MVLTIRALLLAILFAVSVRVPVLAVDDPAPFPDMGKAVGDLLKKHYYDPKRFHPRILVERARRALETTEM